MSVFNERRAIPQRTVHPVRGGIEVLAEDKSLREGRDGYVRELDVNLLFDLHTAETISRWLTAQIQKLKEAISEGERAKEALQDGVKS
jgi:hypothetical protein